MSQSKTLLSVQHLSVSYGKSVVFEDLNLDVFAGETFGFIGLNGAGKTTLIKTVLGLREPNSGEILIDGSPQYDSEHRKLIAYLPERFEPPWFLSGLEFIRFSMKLYGRSIEDQDVFDAAQEVALDKGALHRRAHTYSKGMRQKLGLLATILTGCPLLLLDEPMSGLDPLARHHVKAMLGQVKKQGHTVFLSSHILSDMLDICDRIAVLHKGKIMYTGAPDKLCSDMNKPDLEQAFLSLTGDF